MHRNPSRSGTSARLAGSLLAAGVAVGIAATAHATAYQITDLVTDDPAALAMAGLPPATFTDADLVNPWGISHGATPFWVSDNGTGLATLYNGAGVKAMPAGLPHVIVSPPASSSPTGTVFNGGTGFVLPGTTLPARFIFATEQGTITGWNNMLADPSHTVLGVQTSGAIYKGLAIGSNASGTFLYAANFSSGKVDVFNSSFSPTTLSGNFTDPSPPPVPAGGQGWAPFNVQTLNVGGQDRIFVAYAVQAGTGDDLPGQGHGFVDEFDTDGNFIRRIATDTVLNSPWGLDIAPTTFGQFANDLLVGNFGDGTIHAFDPNSTNAQPLGTLLDGNGNPITIDGLWTLTNGDGATGAIADAVYFTAGIDDEMHGVFGDLTVAAAAVPEPGSLALLMTGMAGLMWLRRRRTV